MTKEKPTVLYNGVDPAKFGTLDEKGREIMDPIPMAPPIGYQRQPSLAERIRDMVRSEQMRLAAGEMGAETFEESEDFDVDDEYDPTSPWEEEFDPIEENLRMELRQREFAAKYNERMEKAMRRAGVRIDGPSPVDERGDTVAGDVRGHSDKKPTGKSKSQQDASAKRGVRDTDRSSGEVEE